MSAFLYAVTAAFVILIAARVTRMSRGAALALLLFPLVLTARSLFTGAIYGPLDLAYTSEPLASIAESVAVEAVANPSVSDVYTEFFPWNDALRRAIRRGEWPHWNPYELSGTPLAGAAQVAPYHPITIAGLLLPITGYFAYAAGMLYLVAAVSAFVLIREFTESEGAALFGAAGWMASTHLIFFAGTAMANAVSLTPLVLLGARRIALEPGRRSAAILGISLLLLVLSGHPETALHVVSLAVAYFAYSVVVHREGRRPAAILASGLGAGLGALLLAAFFLLPHVDAILQSEEYIHRAIGYQQKSATPPQIAHRLIANVFPFLEGAAGVEEPLHKPEVRHGWLPTAYAGSILFPAMLAGLRRARDRWFFAGMIIFGFGAGLALPGFTHLFNHLPGFDIAVNDRMVVFATLGMCVLAAQALDALRSPLPFVITAMTVVAAAIMLPSEVSTDYRWVGAARATIPLLLGAGAIVVLPRHALLAVLTGLLLLQRYGESAWIQANVPAKAFYPAFPGVELIKSHEPFRIVATGPILPPAISTHYGLEDVRGFQAVTFARYDQTYPLWSKRQPVWSNRVDDLNSPFLSAMNVRYALIAPDLTLPSWWARIGSYGAYDIAQNGAVLPRAWVPRSVRFTRDLLETQGVLRDIQDFAAVSTIEDRRAHSQRVPNGPGTVSIAGGGSRWRLRASMQRPGWVVVSNAAWRGWKATSAGKKLRIRFANHAFLGIHLPAGTHDIDLIYRPRSFVIGSVISSVTAVVIAAIYSGIASSAITFFMSFQTSFFAAGVRRR